MARGSNPLIGSNRLYNQIMRRYRSSYYKPRSLRRLENKSRRNFILTIILGLVGVYLLLSWGLPALIGGLTTLNKFRHEGKTPAVAVEDAAIAPPVLNIPDRKSTRLNSSHQIISYAVFCLKKKKKSIQHKEAKTRQVAANVVEN